jgi:GNAT superfamily N-acetyltransferase
MNDIIIRDINPEIEPEIDLVTNRCMETVLETIPEFDNNPNKAREQFSNFSFVEMKEMIKNSLMDLNHKLLVAINDKQEIVGHSIFSLKEDKFNKIYGFCFSRYVLKDYRRKGIATMLLNEAEIWWKKNNASYIIANTHEKNIKLINLFRKFKYKMSEPKQNGLYKFRELKKII